MLLLRPGQRGALVLLQDVLREAHDAYRASVLDAIKTRKGNGVPLDDDTSWQALADLVPKLGQAVTSRLTSTVEDLAEEIRAAVAGNALADPGIYKPDPRLDGIRVRFAVITAPERSAIQATINDAARDFRRARSSSEALAADERAAAAQADLVRLCVVEIQGIGVLDAAGNEVDAATVPLADLLPALRLADLVRPLFLAARHFLALPAKKALLCGAPPTTESQPSSATPAPQSNEMRAAAPATAPASTSAAPLERPDAACGGT